MTGSDALVDTSALELARTGLRFTNEATEAEYRAWHVGQAIAMTRIGMLAAIFNWITLLVVLAVVSAGHFAETAAWIGLVMVPLMVASVAVSYRRVAWMLPLTTAAIAVGGLTVVGICFWALGSPWLSAVSALFVSQFAFTIFRLRVPTASLAVAPFVALHQILTIGVYQAGSVDADTTLLISFAPYLGYISGVIACAAQDRSSRQSFRQERIIAAQRLAIEREHARADVAERSRALTEALLRLTTAGRAVRLRPGDVVEERYRVVRALGAGGMGEVHEVERIADARRLALKVLTGATDRDALVRFAREAQIAATVDHPNVVSALDVGVAPSGMFLVMELVAGGTLVAARARFGDVAWAFPILRQIADALAAMHDRGIVHRDLKPGNILLDGDRPKITDFGIASLAEAPPVEPVRGDGATAASSSDGALTRTGMILGTPLYMAPELTKGARDARSSADIWSFGVMAHELLAGRLPFAEPPLLARLADRSPPACAPLAVALDPQLRAVLDRCLALDPEARPTASTLLEALRRSLAGAM